MIATTPSGCYGWEMSWPKMEHRISKQIRDAANPAWRCLTHNAFFPAGLLLATAVLRCHAADSDSIYHEGWIDLDKNGKEDVYEDPSQPVAKRVDDLLSRMTMAEKIGQLWQPAIPAETNNECVGQLQAGAIGSFLCDEGSVETPPLRNKLQHIAVEHSRLGIPLIFGFDVIHGLRTIFPIPLAQACAWEPDLFERTQTVAAREATAAGIDWTFAPMVDLARDPRWGRIAEGFGEDPWLGACDAAACVRGFQGTNVADANHVVACLKHFAGYGAAEGGRDYNTTEISEFTLRNFYLPPFKAGVDAGVYTLMSAFNCLSGFPASGDRHTLTDILRREWNFTGFMVSDYNAVIELEGQGVVASDADAARLALTAGVDMEMVSTAYPGTLPLQIKAGRIPESVVDEAVRRILTVKFEKGLFDHPFTDATRWQTAFLQPDAVALAREAAVKACVLLKNENAVLPISRRVKKVALIGPLADNAEELVGSWCGIANADDVVSLADGIRAKLAANAQLTVARGCRFSDSGKVRRHLNGAVIHEAPTGAGEIAAAVALAQSADAVILALGEPRNWSGEDGSRSELTVTGKQMELFEAVATTGKPVIVVLFNGRPLALTEFQDKAAAILEAWHPGVQGGNAVADILFGDAEPSGRLTTTFPRSVGQVPFYYNHFNTGRPGFGEYKGNYADGPTTPLYPFGFGLDYTTFEFGKVVLNTDTISESGTISAWAKIKNTGDRPGVAVAELYLRALVGSAGPRPVRELKGLRKIVLQPGESQEVSFELSGPGLGYYSPGGEWLVEPGKFQLWISSDSASGKPAVFELK